MHTCWSLTRFIVSWIALWPTDERDCAIDRGVACSRWAWWHRAVIETYFFPPEARGQRVPCLDQEEHNGRVADVWTRERDHTPRPLSVTWVV